MEGTSSTGKLYKNFAVNDDMLSLVVTDEDLQKAGLTLNPKKEDSMDFEIVEPEVEPSPFVSAAIVDSQRTLTEKGAPTFSTSGDSRVDFFFHVIEQTDADKVIDLLEASWNKDGLHTLQLVASLRDIKDGKGIRRPYQHCLFWLYKNHPRTLYENLSVLASYGYWKDLLHLLMTISFNGFVHPYFAADDGVKNVANIKRQRHAGAAVGRGRGRGSSRGSSRLGRGGLKRRAVSASVPRCVQSDAEKRIYNEKILEFFKIDKKVTEVKSNEMTALRLKFARSKLEARVSNVKYRAFHLKVAQLFAGQLVTDYNALNKNNNSAGSGDNTDKKKEKKVDISLAAKWAPTLEGHFDRYTLIASTIAVELAKLLGKDDILKKDKIAVAVYLSRKFYNKEVCIPLRANLEIPEGFMSRGEWSQVNYARVPAKCMKKNKNHFIAHDEARLEAYLKKDDAKVAGATLKPIEIIKAAVNTIMQNVSESERIIAEKQWQSLAEDIKKKGGTLLSGAVCVCDVSGSMDGDPMIAAIGLTLLTMNMSLPPWNSICITFHEQPSIHNVSPNLSLIQKVTSLKNMSWGGTTNFQSVFEKILSLGMKNKLKPEEMPKILFVFTDMEFDSAFPRTNQTNFEYAKSMFTKNGYEMPTMVFWNLRDSPGKKSTPVQIDERGTILLSGWSGQLLAFIMSQKDLSNCTPWSFVLELVGKKKYQALKIYD